MKTGKLSDVRLRDVKITDPFWNHYIKLVKDVIIPYQWNILNDQQEGVEPSYCIHNFKVAAGEKQGEIKGVVFLDSDLAKWLEAVAYSLETNPDEELERLADGAISLIGRGQQPDGYLGTYFTVKDPGQRFMNLQEGHELYTTGHMIEAAVAYYYATGKDEFLNIMCRMADLLCTYFGTEEGKCHGYPGHQEIELALVKLYQVTGTQRYLDLAMYFIDARGVGENYFIQEEKRGKKRIFPEFADYQPVYSQSHLPVRKQRTAEGHAVRAVYMYSAMADLAGVYQDEELLQACKTLWNNITGKRMYITGGIGSSGILERFTTDYDLPNDSGYSETCASIGMAMFGKRMAQITRQSAYMDIVELELYNNILAGIARDGKSFFYVNPLEVWPDNCIPRTTMEHVKPVRQKWFGVACCPPNIARTLASIGQYMIFTDGAEVYVNLYISSQTHVRLHDDDVSITLNSNMPYSGRCELTADGSEDKKISVALRIPAYAVGFRIADSDGQVLSWQEKDGYAHLDMGAGMTCRIEWDMKARFVRANPQVRENIGKVALMRGPLVYCLEEADNGINLPGIYVDTSIEPQEIVDQSITEKTACVQLAGRKIRSDSRDQPLYGTYQPEFETVKIKAVPYFLWNNRGAGEMLVWMKEAIKNYI